VYFDFVTILRKRVLRTGLSASPVALRTCKIVHHAASNDAEGTQEGTGVGGQQRMTKYFKSAEPAKSGSNEADGSSSSDDGVRVQRH
jgi:hypothetical protein